MVRIHWENMPPYQIVLALLQDSVLPLGRFVCWSLLAASWTFLRNLAHLLKFAKSSLNHDFHTLQANVHTKTIIMILHGKNEGNFFKTRRWFSKNFFSHIRSSSVVALRFYPIFYLPLMSWNEGTFWACHQIFSSQKRLKPLSLALFSFVVHSEFFFTWICHKKASYLIEVEMSTTSIVAAATKEGLFLCGASSKRLFQKEPIFREIPVHALFKQFR